MFKNISFDPALKYLYADLESLSKALLFDLKQRDPHHELADRLIIEVSNIKTKLKEIYFEPWPHSVFENFTKIHHEGLIDLMNEALGKRLLPKESNADLYAVYRVLNELLHFIQHHFEKYIPKHQVIPELLRKPLLLEVRGYKKQICHNLGHCADPALVIFLLKPFIDFIQKSDKCTWHNLFYCRVVHKEFLKHKKKADGVASMDLIWMLYHLNYNSHPFYRFLSNYILESTTENGLQDLYCFQKKVLQAPVRFNVVYKPDNMGLSKMMEKWFDEEIRYLERTKQIKLNFLSEPLNSKADILNHKIQTNLSVSELAYMFRIMADTKFLRVENHREFFRSICKAFRTPGSEEISAESLRSKYYTSETSVIASIKTRLINLLNHINATSKSLIIIGGTWGTCHLRDWTNFL